MKIDYGWKSSQQFRRWGPYMSFWENSGTQMRITWQSKFYSLEEWINYGETENCGTIVKNKIEPSAMHSFLLTNLKPNTIYYYKISRSEDLQIKPQPIYIFKTGPEIGENSEFEFCIVSDMHATDGNAKRTFESMKLNAPNAHFIATCGDCVTHGGVEEMWNEFFYEFDEYAQDFVLMNTTGNHDTDHPETYAHFIQTFHHPYFNKELGGFYHFIYGNAVFIMLDSTNAGQTQATQGVVSDKQMEWLEEILEKYGKQDFWIFIFMHHPFYSTGDSGMMYLYELAYRDLFDEYQVDGVFFGHDHHWECYWTGRDTEWGGTHYCLVGNGGGGLSIEHLRNAKRKPKPTNYLWKGRTYIFERDGILGGDLKGFRNDDIIKKAYVYGILEYGFTHMRINGNECKMKVIGWQNQTFFEDKFKRTGTGKKFHNPKFLQEF